MKDIFLMFTILFGSLALSAQTTAVDITFDKEHHLLGDVVKGEKKTFKYNFENTGTDVIEIEIVSGCDCTTLDWTRGPINVGEKGTIDVIFDSTEKEASETVDVDIYLKNINPISDSQYLFVLDYTFDLVKK
ncbi:MAG: peptidoglycan-associated lipoprotein [Saprospiraceae bacterium]|jgi:peptidoglycan-associated lipoprotein